uniref:DUF4283 domain-containing protein n=1 Tax=Tanacetum cinerariifolium TaxID=118510 RepID=A0A6L2JAW0_TANCI|nr:hypothetical protein [Tanacetum cinerariifolium]
MDECVSMSTPMATERLDADLQGTLTDQMTYLRMIGRIMYLIASRPDIAFATFVCARYQARPAIKHLKESKARVGMKISSWMITNEMKLTEHYQMYVAVFVVDVPTTQLQLIESTKGTHRTTSASIRSTQLTPQTSIPTTTEADEIILQDTIQLSLAEQKSRDELEAKQNVQKVEEHLIVEEIKNLVEGAENAENAEVDSTTLRQNDNQNDPGTSGVKKKKEGISKVAEKEKKDGSSLGVDETPILGGIAMCVTNIDGKTNVPKIILKKAARNVVSDNHEVVKPTDGGGSASKVSFEAAENVCAKPCSPTAAANSNGPKIGCLFEAVGDPSVKDDATKFSPKSCGSFAGLLKPNDATNKVHFHTLVNEERVESVDCVLPKAAAAKYVSNTWRKFGFERITLNDDGVYLFKFATKSGEATKVPVWVKLYNVLVLAYSEDGLTLIGTQIEVIMAILEEEGDGYIKEVVRVEYEWKPPHCVDCKSFGHDTNLCPKRVREEGPKNSARDAKTTTMEENDDGFTEVMSRKKNKGANFGGIRLNKPKSKVMWPQKKGVDAKTSSCASSNEAGNGNGVSQSDLKTSNPFDMLNENSDAMDDFGSQPKVNEHVNSDLNVNRKEASKPSSSQSVYGDGHKDKNISGGNQLEDEDFDFYKGYADQVVDLDGALKEFRDFKLSISALLLDDPHDDAHPKGENDAKRQKTSDHGTYVSRESSSGQVNKSKPGPSTSSNQEQLDDFDFWMNSYATDDDELLTTKVSQELVNEMSQNVDEA